MNDTILGVQGVSDEPESPGQITLPRITPLSLV